MFPVGGGGKLNGVPGADADDLVPVPLEGVVVVVAPDVVVAPGVVVAVGTMIVANVVSWFGSTSDFCVAHSTSQNVFIILNTFVKLIRHGIFNLSKVRNQVTFSDFL